MSQTIERDEHGRFVKGASANAGGRPAQPAEVKEMLKASTLPALRVLIETMNNEGAALSLRVRCAETLLDRCLGKAIQPLEAIFPTPELDLSGLTIQELRRLAAHEDEPEETDGGEGGEN